MVRRSIFWFHLAAGLLASIPLVAMAGTGILLSFRPQILALADEAPVPPAAADRLPLDTLVARLSTGHRGTVASIALDADPSRPVEIRLGKDAAWRLDPRDGRVLGARRLESAFATVERLHRWLGSRETGGKVTGVSVLLCLFLSASGLVLWWPRNLAALRRVAWPRRGLRGRARDWQWHNAVGAAVLPLLLVLSLTGTVLSWKWAEALLHSAAGGEAPRSGERSRPADGRGTGRQGRDVPDPTGNWQSWADTALAHAPPGWTSVRISPPRAPGGGATANFRTSRDAVPSGGAVLLTRAGGFDSWKPARTDRGTRLRFLVKPLHTGELFGIAGQALMAAASAGLLLLVWTGLAMAWRRLRTRPG